MVPRYFFFPLEAALPFFWQQDALSFPQCQGCPAVSLRCSFPVCTYQVSYLCKRCVVCLLPQALPTVAWTNPRHPLSLPTGASRYVASPALGKLLQTRRYPKSFVRAQPPTSNRHFVHLHPATDLPQLTTVEHDLTERNSTYVDLETPPRCRVRTGTATATPVTSARRPSITANEVSYPRWLSLRPTHHNLLRAGKIVPSRYVSILRPLPDRLPLPAVMPSSGASNHGLESPS